MSNWVVIGKTLEQALGSGPALELANTFSDWKDGLYEVGKVFGRDVPFRRHRGAVEEQLWHVHLEEARVTADWADKRRRGYPDPWHYTSDTILVYGQMTDLSYQPYMLMAVFTPNGHDDMESPSKMDGVVAEYTRDRKDFSWSPDKSGWTLAKL